MSGLRRIQNDRATSWALRPSGLSRPKLSACSIGSPSAYTRSRRGSPPREKPAYCHGDSVTIADICLASITAVMKIFRISAADLPTAEWIIELCETLEAFAKAAPFKQAGVPES